MSKEKNFWISTEFVKSNMLTIQGKYLGIITTPQSSYRIFKCHVSNTDKYKQDAK